MSFWKKLFGLGGSDAAPAALQSQEHEGFSITPTPYKENGQFQMCGVIEKDIAGEKKTHRFVRADRFSSIEEAEQFTLAKARQIIDQMGERVFK